MRKKGVWIMKNNVYYNNEPATKRVSYRQNCGQNSANTRQGSQYLEMVWNLIACILNWMVHIQCRRKWTKRRFKPFVFSSVFERIARKYFLICQKFNIEGSVYG